MQIDATTFLSGLLENSPDALVALTPQGRVTFWNQGAHRMFGYTSHEAIGRTLDELIVPESRLAEEQGRLQSLDATAPVTYESERRRKDGTLLYVNISTSVARDAAGTLTYILVTTRDVTHLKVQHDAQLLEAKYRDLLDSTPDAIVMVNRTGRIVLVNIHAERLFGYARQEMIGKLVEILLPARFRDTHAGHRSHYIGQPRTRSMGAGLELYGLRRDGTEFPVEISLTPLESEHGTLVMSAIRDVTDRKQAEKALQDANAELESFAYSVSHDLRAPLRAIDGFSRAVLDDHGALLPPQARQDLQCVREGAQQMAQLIDDLLAFSRLSRQSLTIQAVSPRDLLEAAWSDLARERDGRRITFQVAELPFCQADPVLLKQVWMNLLSNALKYTRHQAEVVIEVASMPAREIRSARGSVPFLNATAPSSAPSAALPPNQIGYTVRDNGVGFDMHYAHKLFGVFQRLHRTEDYEGTGVGLAIVKRIIQRHGGIVWAESQPNQYTTFGFTLEPGVRP